MTFRPQSTGDAQDHRELGHSGPATPEFNPLQLLSEHRAITQGNSSADSLPAVTLASDTLSLSPTGMRQAIDRLNVSIPGDSQFPDLDPRLQNLILRRIRMTWGG
jgi:hypothetical protein